MKAGFAAYFANLWLAFSRKHRKLERVSREYWATSNFTFLGGDIYYAKREIALRRALSSLGAVETAVDISSGNGRFSMLNAEYANSLIGYDISPALITAARQQAAENGISRVQFRVAELGEVPMADKFQLVTCLGVVSCMMIADLRLWFSN